MNSRPAPDPGVRIVKALLLLTGAALVFYAISDHPFYGGEPGFGQTQMLMCVAGVGLALCSLLPRRIAGNILLVTLTFFIMLAVLEIAGEAVLKPYYRPVYQYDDRLIFKFIPNRESVMKRSAVNGGIIVFHHINSEGFRGEELLPAGKSARIAVYGDSFIHAYYSPQEETFTVQLGMQIEKRAGKKFEMVNAGVSSYGPDQELLKMESELPRLRPDLVVVSIYAGNDYGDLMRDKMFKLGINGELAPNPWKLDPKVRALLELNQRESIIKRAVRGYFDSMHPPDRSGLSSVDFLLAEAGREYRSFIVERNDFVTNTHVDYFSADVCLTPKSESARYKVELMRAVMRGIRDVAAKNNVPLVFLFIPHAANVADHYDSWQFDRKRFPDYDERNQIAPLEEAARSLGVPFLSLFDAYRKADANSLYFHDDDHWNGAGQRMAAELMADYLLAQGLLKSGK